MEIKLTNLLRDEQFYRGIVIDAIGLLERSLILNMNYFVFLPPLLEA